MYETTNQQGEDGLIEVGWLLVGLLFGVGIAGAGLRAYSETPQACPHPHWEEVRRAFMGGGATGDIPISTLSHEQEWIRELFYGITSIEYRCVKCNAPNEQRMVGNHLGVSH